MIIMFLGMPGSGKTQAMIDFVSAQADTHRFFVVDRAADWGPTDEAGAENPRWRGNAPEIIIAPPPRWAAEGRGCPTCGHGSEIPAVEDDQLVELAQIETGVVLFRNPWTAHSVAQLCVDIGNCVYVDDEIDVEGTQATWAKNPLKEVVHRGRHLMNRWGDILEAHILGAARRPQSIATDLTNIADQAFIFRVGGSRTLQRLRDDAWIEDEEWDAIRNLPDLTYRHWPSGRYEALENAFQR